jgi:hypothetical protein
MPKPVYEEGDVTVLWNQALQNKLKQLLYKIHPHEIVTIVTI